MKNQRHRITSFRKRTQEKSRSRKPLQFYRCFFATLYFCFSGMVFADYAPGLSAYIELFLPMLLGALLFLWFVAWTLYRFRPWRIYFFWMVACSPITFFCFYNASEYRSQLWLPYVPTEISIDTFPGEVVDLVLRDVLDLDDKLYKVATKVNVEFKYMESEGFPEKISFQTVWCSRSLPTPELLEMLRSVYPKGKRLILYKKLGRLDPWFIPDSHPTTDWWGKYGLDTLWSLIGLVLLIIVHAIVLRKILSIYKIKTLSNTFVLLAGFFFLKAIIIYVGILNYI